MFNNTNPYSNGEYDLYLTIKDNIKVIFDIGCREDSIFTEFTGIVHYFEPVKCFLENFITIPKKNSLSYYNNIALGQTEGLLYYYPKYQSFYDRINSCGISNDNEKIYLQMMKAEKYIEMNNIKRIDFVKIDTEGYEFEVIKSFGPYLLLVKYLQFEYGGTYKDNGINLITVINYLKNMGFEKFYYMSPNNLIEIIDYGDHYQYCNIFCMRP